jgi:hypothetical protein
MSDNLPRRRTRQLAIRPARYSGMFRLLMRSPHYPATTRVRRTCSATEGYVRAMPASSEKRDVQPVE